MVRERGREKTRRDGEEHSSQLDGAGRLSMPRSAQARVRVLFLSVLVSLALLSFLTFPLSLSLPLVVSYARSAARIRKYKTSRGSLFSRLRVVVPLRFFFCFVGHAREENPTKFRFFVYIS